MFRILLLILLGFVASGLNASVFEEFFPQNIKLGLSTEQMEAVRPASTRSPAALLPRSDQTTLSSFEMVERIPPAIFYIYAFRDNILQAVIRSEPVITNVPSSINQTELNNSLSREFQLVRSDKIARASGTLEHFPVTADLWKNPKSGLQAYVVSTSQETTLIFFNPAKLNAGSFFLGADKIPEFKAGTDAIHSKTKTDPKASPPLIDHTWESKPDGSSPTSATSPVSLDPPQVSRLVNLFVALVVLLAVGSGVLSLILKRR